MTMEPHYMLKSWIDLHAGDLASDGIQATLTEEPQDRDKKAAWVDLDSGGRLVRLTLWDTGEAVLSLADAAADNSILVHQLELTGPSDPERAIVSAIGWVTGRLSESAMSSDQPNPSERLARIRFFTTQEGGRLRPPVSGVRSQIQLGDIQTSCVIRSLNGMNLIPLGEEAVVAVRLLFQDEVGQEFAALTSLDLFEGSKHVATGAFLS